MSVRFGYRNTGAPDLYRRGLRPETAPPAVLLADIEADLAVRDGVRVVFAEESFPVAELARALVGWLLRPDRGRGGFAFESMAFPEPGAVRIEGPACGWRVGSALRPDAWTAPVAWEALAAEIGRFAAAVRADVARLGADPGLIPDL
ncbi:DUF7878 domain-containing protein [Nocardiopsis potens]|uniref:DUF7878 domain-containing protein n=1 Tax=Nocardiopsis potens TaxID=1246458 RepID=UPI0003829FC1|nr:hypothetical protein [Nocardiopsis potens]